MILVISLLVDVRCCVGTTASCDNDVGDVGVAELEEPVDKPGTTIGTSTIGTSWVQESVLRNVANLNRPTRTSVKCFSG